MAAVVAAIDDVVTGATDHGIDTFPTRQNIVAVPAFDLIIPRAAQQDVVTPLAVNLVIPFASVDEVGVRQLDKRVRLWVVVVAVPPVIATIDDVVARTTKEGVGIVAAIDLIVTIVPVDGVAVRHHGLAFIAPVIPAIKHVVAHAAMNHVVA